MLKRGRFTPLLICLVLTASAQTKEQTKEDSRSLEPGQVVEREIAGGQRHIYLINLRSGQLARLVVVQLDVDVTLAFASPDGKPISESNLTAAGGQESLSVLADHDGMIQLAARATQADAPAGAYRLRLEIKTAPTAHDRRRIDAERLLAEAKPLRGEAAVEKLQLALPQWRELGDPYWETYTILAIGNAYLQMSRFPQTIEQCEQGLAISRRIQDRYSEALALATIGIAHSNMGRLEQAREYFEQSLVVRRAAKLRAGEAVSLMNLGVNNNMSSKYERAIEYLDQALAILLELKDRGTQGRARHNLGESYYFLGRFDRATEQYEEALAIFREVKDRQGESASLNSLGRVYIRNGHPERAIEYMEQALQIRRELKDRNGEGTALNFLAVTYRSIGRFEKARECLEQSLRIAREVKNPATEAVALNNLGSNEFDLGRPEQAIQFHEQSLQIRRQMKSPGEVASVLSNLGNVHTFLGQYEKGVDYYEQALAIYREVKNRTEEGGALNNLGIVYRYLGLLDKSISVLEKALAISQEVKDRDYEGRTLNNLANTYQSQGRYKEAIERFEQALTILRETKNRAAEGTLLSNIGLTYVETGSYERAAQYFEQALALNREAADRPTESTTLAGLGKAFQMMGKREMAIGYFQQALAIQREVKDPAREIPTLSDFAATERELGHLDTARNLIERSLELIESLRADIYNPDQRAAYFASTHNIYNFYVDLLMELSRARPGQGYDSLAVAASERSRARGLIEILGESGANIRQGVDAGLLARERALALELNAKAQQLARVRGADKAAVQEEIGRLEDEYQKAQVAIRRASPRFTALARPQPLSLPEIQRQLDAGTVLLEYSLGKERSYLWAIRQNGLTSYELPGREEIEKAARKVYDLLTARGRSLRDETPTQKRGRFAIADAQLPEAADRLSRMLLSPAAAELDAKRLIVVADGALQYLPFAMLPDPRADERKGKAETIRKRGALAEASAARRPSAPTPLMAEHEIVNLPSISALAVQRVEVAGRKPSPRGVAVIADPVFYAADTRVKAVAPKPSTPATPDDTAPDPVATRIIEHLNDDSGKAVTRKIMIPRLPYTRQEADRILAVAPGSTNLEAIDFKASRAIVMDKELGQYRYIHFATHGVLDSERPGLSSLVLSLVDEEGKAKDGFLRAHEIYNLDLPAELIVLSACQTGLGKEIKGEGLVGLTRGFMYAGAARVVVSLWNVNDKATSELMAKFYQKMLKEGQRPAAALQSAQVEMWRQGQWRSPYYWAPFVLQGEWR
jgi:CHAT domain-containing protein/tetratricopeptide (TPR) repeat protein